MVSNSQATMSREMDGLKDRWYIDRWTCDKVTFQTLTVDPRW